MRRIEILTNQIIENVAIGKRCKIWYFINLYNSIIGDDVNIGAFVEIQKAKIGNRCRIANGSFIPNGVIIGDDCFIGPKVCFTTDKYPSVKKAMTQKQFWPEKLTVVGNRVIIGANTTILPGISIEEGAIIGAGSLVTKDIGKNEVWYGSPAVCVRKL